MVHVQHLNEVRPTKIWQDYRHEKTAKGNRKRCTTAGAANLARASLMWPSSPLSSSTSACASTTLA